ncbi:MAG: hypothetical protein ACLUNQ_05835 [Oscillospiraceae bacterium]
MWVKLGRLVYGASNDDLETILGNKGCNCSALVFENSFWHPQVTPGVLRQEEPASAGKLLRQPQERLTTAPL